LGFDPIEGERDRGLKGTAMRQTIIGHDGLIEVEQIANMLRSLALPLIDGRNVKKPG